MEKVIILNNGDVLTFPHTIEFIYKHKNGRVDRMSKHYYLDQNGHKHIKTETNHEKI